MTCQVLSTCKPYKLYVEACCCMRWYSPVLGTAPVGYGAGSAEHQCTQHGRQVAPRWAHQLHAAVPPAAQSACGVTTCSVGSAGAHKVVAPGNTKAANDGWRRACPCHGLLWVQDAAHSVQHLLGCQLGLWKTHCGTMFLLDHFWHSFTNRRVTTTLCQNTITHPCRALAHTPYHSPVPVLLVSLISHLQQAPGHGHQVTARKTTIPAHSQTTRHNSQPNRCQPWYCCPDTCKQHFDTSLAAVSNGCALVQLYVQLTRCQHTEDQLGHT